MTKVTLTFDGFRRESTIEGVSNNAGIYFVHSGKHTGPSECEINKLIYIGQAADIKDRLEEHISEGVLEEHLNQDDELYFSWTVTGNETLGSRSVEDSRILMEKALIFEHKPPGNTKIPDKKPSITVITKGESGL